MSRKTLPLLVLSIFLTAEAQAATYEIDVVHSSVEFKVKHLVGKTGGRFKNFSGTIEYDEKNPERSTVNVKIDAKSIDTNNSMRDDHLKNPDFLETEKHPDMTFVSKKVDPAASTLTGDLTLHGVTKEVTIRYEMGGLAADKDGKRRLGGSGTAKFDRTDFGIKYDPTGVTVGKEIAVQLEIEAVERG